MGLSTSFFGERFNITERDLERYLAEALSRGGDYADLYFEYLATSNISMDESIVKSATQDFSGASQLRGQPPACDDRDQRGRPELRPAANGAPQRPGAGAREWRRAAERSRGGRRKGRARILPDRKDTGALRDGSGAAGGG